MEQLFETFDMNEERFLEVKKNVTSFMNSYFNGNMDEGSQKYFSYYSDLDSDCEEYLQFGADKCDVDNFDEFCEDLNVDIKENLLEIIQNQKHYIEDMKYGKIKNLYEYKPVYLFYSRDKKITFTCSNPGNYMHYFGITGESNKILEAFKIFKKRCTYDEACFGSRDFI
jgi:hypothetical protein